MSLRVGTKLRITLEDLVRAEFFLCADGAGQEIQPAIAEDFQIFFRHGCGDGLRRQIKDALRQFFRHCLHRRVQHRKSLSDAGGCLHKEVPAPPDAAEHIHRDPLLPGTVGIGEIQRRPGTVPFLPVICLKMGPAEVLPCQIFHPGIQRLRRHNGPEPADLLRFEIAVGHLADHFGQVFFFAEHIGVAVRLGKVQRLCLREPQDVRIDTLDLVHHHRTVTAVDAVGPPFHEKHKVSVLKGCLQRYLCLVGSGHGTLDLPVDPSARQHRLRVRTRLCSVVDISGPQDKLDQRPD